MSIRVEILTENFTLTTFLNLKHKNVVSHFAVDNRAENYLLLQRSNFLFSEDSTWPPRDKGLLLI